MNGVLLALLLLVQGIVVPGTQAGTVQGRILNLDGTPAARVRVTAQSVAESPDAAAEAPVLSSLVQTDADGRYRLDGVTPGRYYVGAGLLNLLTYYPGVTSIAQARIVTVGNGAQLTGIDFKLGQATALKVSGHVKAEAGATMLGQARVRMIGSIGGPTRNVPFSDDGSFAFEGVPPGWYTIGVSGTNGSQPQSIFLNDKDLEVELVVKAMVGATGKVTVVGDGPKPRVTLLFSDGAATRPSTSSNGTFAIQLPVGDYRVTVNGSLPPGYNVRSITAGSVNWLLEPARVSVGQPLPEFVVELDVSSPPPWVRVKGRVKGFSSATTRSSVPHRVNMTGASAGEILEAAVEIDGTFEFPQVIPGSYSFLTNMSVAGARVQPLQVTVGSADMDNLEIVLPAVISVAGRLVVEGTGTQRLPVLPLAFSDGYASRYVSAVPSADGRFSISLPEGEHQLGMTMSVASMDGYTLKSITYGSEDALARSVKFDPADVGRKELVVTLIGSAANNSARVTGRVTNLASAGGLRISMIGGDLSATEYLAAVTSADGSFEIPDVPPGTYTLRAIAPVPGLIVSTTVSVSAGQVLRGIELAFPSQKN